MENRIVYLSFKRNDGPDVYEKGQKYINCDGALVSYSLGGKFVCVTTTVSCLEQNGWLDDLDYEVVGPIYHQIPGESVKDLLMNYKIIK